MRNLFVIIILAYVLTAVQAMALQPFLPNGKSFNDISIAANYANEINTSEILVAGSTSYVIPISVEATSVVMAQLNTNSGQYVTSVVPAAGKITIYLNSSLTSDSNISIIGRIK